MQGSGYRNLIELAHQSGRCKSVNTSIPSTISPKSPSSRAGAVGVAVPQFPDHAAHLNENDMVHLTNKYQERTRLIRAMEVNRKGLRRGYPCSASQNPAITLVSLHTFNLCTPCKAGNLPCMSRISIMRPQLSLFLLQSLLKLHIAPAFSPLSIISMSSVRREFTDSESASFLHGRTKEMSLMEGLQGHKRARRGVCSIISRFLPFLLLIVGIFLALVMLVYVKENQEVHKDNLLPSQQLFSKSKFQILWLHI